LELDPDNTAALASLASLSFYEGNLDNATSWNKKLVAVAPQNKDAYYFLGLLAWRKSYPAYATARAQAKMSERKRRPLPPSAVKQKLISSFSSVIEDGISNLKRALELDPDYDDAMTYMSLLISERAGLRDSAKECSRDLATAKEWAQRALETKKRKAATSGAPDRMPLQQDVQCSTIDRLYPA
jgi:tetratricopeptide (TPR) repeat protein